MSYGFTFDGIASADEGLIVTDIRRPLMSNVKNVLISVPSKAGGYYVRSDRDVGKIEIDITLQGTSVVDAQTKTRSLAGWLRPGSLKTLVCGDETDKYYDAVLDGQTNLKQIVEAKQGTLAFIYPKASAESITSSSLDFANDAAAPNNGGTDDARPIIDITLTAGASNFTVTNTDTGRFIKVTLNLVAADTVTMDCEKELLQINGADAMSDLDLTSDFFALKPGVNNLAISPAGVCTAKVIWTERWL